MTDLRKISVLPDDFGVGIVKVVINVTKSVNDLTISYTAAHDVLWFLAREKDGGFVGRNI